MVFIYIPPKASSNLTTTPPNNLTEISTTTEPLPEAILATLATASPLKSTSPEPTIMPEKFTPEFLTQEFAITWPMIFTKRLRSTLTPADSRSYTRSPAVISGSQ